MSNVIFINEEELKYIEVLGILMNISIDKDQDIEVCGIGVAKDQSIASGWTVWRVLNSSEMKRLESFSKDSIETHISDLEERASCLRKILRKNLEK